MPPRATCCGKTGEHAATTGTSPDNTADASAINNVHTASADDKHDRPIS